MTSRPYHSAVREQAATVTRAAILDAAEALFADHGYAPVTVGRIAQVAGVAQNTVYSTFGNKAGLIRGLYERAADDDGIQRALDAIATAGDGDEIIALAVCGTGEIVHRHSRPMTVLISNASADPVIAATLREADELLRGRFGLIAGRLETVGALRAGLTAARATDVLAYYLSPESWLRLRGLGWGRDACRSWLQLQLLFALLGTADTRRGRAAQELGLVIH